MRIIVATILLLLSGCALTGIPKGSDPVLDQVFKDLQGCHREYQGALGVTPSFTFSIKCDPTAPAGATAAPAPVGMSVPVPVPAAAPASQPSPAGQLPPPATKPQA